MHRRRAVSGPTGRTTLCLVRHGETDWNRAGRIQGRADVPLNDRGRDQARRTATFLAGTRWSRVVTSPLERASETAAIIAAGLAGGLGDAAPVEMEALAEQDCGLASGLLAPQARVRFPDGRVPGMEPAPALRRRAVAALVDLARRCPNERLVVVTHGAVINAVLTECSGGTLRWGTANLHNACVSVLHLRGETWEIESHNTIAHLMDAPPAALLTA